MARVLSCQSKLRVRNRRHTLEWTSATRTRPNKGRDPKVLLFSSYRRRFSNCDSHQSRAFSNRDSTVEWASGCCRRFLSALRNHLCPEEPAEDTSGKHREGSIPDVVWQFVARGGTAILESKNAAVGWSREGAVRSATT